MSVPVSPTPEPRGYWSKLEVWLGPAWLCPDCGKVLRKPNIKTADGRRFHSGGCDTPMAVVRVVAL